LLILKILYIYQYLTIRFKDDNAKKEAEADTRSSVAKVPTFNDHKTEKWPIRKNPATLAGAELVGNDEHTFVPPYWVTQYTCTTCMTIHVGVCVSMIAGVCGHNRTLDIVLSLEKENTELLIEVKLPEYYTKAKMLKEKAINAKFGKEEGSNYITAMTIRMATMRGNIDDPFVFTARIPLGIDVFPHINDNDWQIVGDNNANRVLNLILKTPHTVAKRGQGRGKEITIDDSSDSN